MLMAEPSTDPGAPKTRGEPAKQPKIGIALGAGGAKGIAHLSMLEALDELGIVPHRIAGSSIGAVIRSLYASGLSAQEIKDKVANLVITKHDTVHTVLSDKNIGKWMEMIDVDFRHSGLLKSKSLRLINMSGRLLAPTGGQARAPSSRGSPPTRACKSSSMAWLPRWALMRVTVDGAQSLLRASWRRAAAVRAVCGSKSARRTWGRRSYGNRDTGIADRL